MVLTSGRKIGVDDLPPKLVESARALPAQAAYRPTSLKAALEEPEKRIIEAALRAHGWNRQATAAALEINRTTLYKKMKRYGLDMEPVGGMAE
ncbi:MAG: helix-turn-helix domain-containing protein [Halobacteriota archaeon]|nr:helix-turn-helix domain-containing protein [Halobacteriota archaeon]